ncbi:hypothetical protein HOY34_21415 [Xinfangfangia sp. D13-10-4-6]|uniref:DUF6538 domain-containing protein n=1 Tax=Pseudogemmobacter hezensis TaxID=2737662 RepID=UPI001554B5F2|nr:DUF6538 domain-containing protein [Pseudogemmobacter hezensis]NPD17740.1 hypothetical protein [Pseudogemmobacter hezensis]
MARKILYLETRKTSHFWRRRVPASLRERFVPEFFCFPLRTHLLREAAELAGRLTVISGLCFQAECDVPPETMTQILEEYARLEIEVADRIRALTPPRSREQAEAAMSFEIAAREALKDAIFRCDREAAYWPIRATAKHLGIEIDDTEVDYATLADRMLRTMIEVSTERENRARGNFSSPAPWVSSAC